MKWDKDLPGYRLTKDEYAKWKCTAVCWHVAQISDGGVVIFEEMDKKGASEAFLSDMAAIGITMESEPSDENARLLVQLDGMSRELGTMRKEVAKLHLSLDDARRERNAAISIAKTAAADRDHACGHAAMWKGEANTLDVELEAVRKERDRLAAENAELRRRWDDLRMVAREGADGRTWRECGQVLQWMRDIEGGLHPTPKPEKAEAPKPEPRQIEATPETTQRIPPGGTMSVRCEGGVTMYVENRGITAAHLNCQWTFDKPPVPSDPAPKPEPDKTPEPKPDDKGAHICGITGPLRSVTLLCRYAAPGLLNDYSCRLSLNTATAICDGKCPQFVPIVEPGKPEPVRVYHIDPEAPDSDTECRAIEDPSVMCPLSTGAGCKDERTGCPTHFDSTGRTW